MPGSSGSGPAPPPVAPLPASGAPHASRRGLRPPPPRREPAPVPGRSPGATTAPRDRKSRARAPSALPKGTEPSLCPAGPGRRPALPAPTFCQIPRPPPARGRTPGAAAGRAPWPAGAPLAAEALPGGRGSGCRPGRPHCHGSGAAASSAPSLSLSRFLPGCQAEEARRGERQRRPTPAEAPAAGPGPPALPGAPGVPGTPGAGERQGARCCGQRGANRARGALGRVGFLVRSFCILNFLKEGGYALLSARLPSKAKSVTIWPFINQTFPTTKFFKRLTRCIWFFSVSNAPINSSQVLACVTSSVPALVQKKK